MEKKCNKCKEVKDYSEFNNNIKNCDKKCYQCRECDSRQCKEYYRKNKENRIIAGKKYHSENPDAYRNSRYKLRYGITIDDYNNLWNFQNGVCATCGEPEKQYKYLVVDHDHRTGKVRGLLCTNCNKALGNVLDKVETLENMIKYLEFDVVAQFTAKA